MTSATSIVVIRSGPATTVQDGGRPGRAAQGVPRSGAADLSAWALGNRLVGNSPGAAGLEVTLGGLEFTPTADVIVALTGATCRPTLSAQPRWSSQSDHSGLNVAFVVPAGETLRLGVAAHGLRCYVAIRGGIDVPPVLGSRATDTLGGIGPAQLRDGDELPIGARGSAVHPAQWSQLPMRPPAGEQVLRFVPGWRSDWFESEALATLTRTKWVVSSTSSRIGLRLDGPALARRTGELPSEPMVTGAIQVPSNGQPIVLGPDSGTTGGYPVIGVVSRDDLSLAGQAPPGSVLRFRLA